MIAATLAAVLGSAAVNSQGATAPNSHEAQNVRPQVFVENQGQWPDTVLFMGRIGGVDVRVERDSIWLQTAVFEKVGRDPQSPTDLRVSGGAEPAEHATGSWHVLRLRVEGAGGGCTPVGEDQAGGVWNYIGERSASHVPAFDRIRFEHVLDGVDWVLMVDDEGRPRFDFELEPGIDEAQIRLQIEGGGAGSTREAWLGVGQGHAEWSFSPPVAFEGEGADRVERPASWSHLGGDAWGIDVERSDSLAALTVDPSIEFLSYLGGNLDEYAQDICVEPSGVVTLTGTTISPTFPITPGVFGIVPSGQATDVYVTRVGESGTTPVWSTVVGATGASPEGLPKIDSFEGRVTVAFATSAFAFPATEGAYVTPFAFQAPSIAVLRLTPDGTEPEYVAMIGSSESDFLKGVISTKQSTVVVYGVSGANDFPVAVNLDSSQGVTPSTDAGFVVELSSDGSSLIRSVLVGGSGADQPQDVKLLESGEMLIGGSTDSTDFPVTSDAFQPTIVPNQVNTDQNGFLVRLNSTWDQVVYGTYVSNTRQGSVNGIEVVGETAYWAVATAIEKDVVFPASVPVDELDPTAGPRLLLLFDQETNELRRAIWASVHGYEDSLLDEDGGLILLGRSFPGAFFPFLTPGEPFGPPGQVSISKLDPLGDRWIWSYGFGGSATSPNPPDTIVVAGDRLGPERFVLTGQTLDSNLPITPGVVDPNKGPAGRWETWFGEFDVAPEGFERFGESTDACNGKVRIGVRSLASAGALEFGLSCIGAPRHAPGVLARSQASVAVPIDIGGLAIHLDLGTLVLSPAQADGLGWAGVDLPLTGIPAGLKAYFQFAWVDPGTCGSVGALSASDAIGVEVQP